MAIIADTLNDIQKLQDEMSVKFKDCEELADSMFICDLMNFTTVYFFELLAHATLDALRDCLQPVRHPYSDKYSQAPRWFQQITEDTARPNSYISGGYTRHCA